MITIDYTYTFITKTAEVEIQTQHSGQISRCTMQSCECWIELTHFAHFESVRAILLSTVT